MRRHIAVFGVVILCVVFFASCSEDNIDIAGYENEKIILSGLADNDEEITIAELKELKCITKKTQSTSDKIGEVKATGPLLTTVAESYGKNLDDYSKVIIYGQDEYDIKLNSDFLKENQVILAIGIDGQPLDKESVPLRIIIPESDSAYWVRMVSKIEFVK